MIRVTRLNSSPLIPNSDLVEHIETTPDTVITLTTGQSLRVRESTEEVAANCRIPPQHPRARGPSGALSEIRLTEPIDACAVQHESLETLQQEVP